MLIPKKAVKKNDLHSFKYLHYYKSQLFPFFLYFKSMKFFKTLSLIGLIGGYASATFTAIDCGEGKVPSA